MAQGEDYTAEMARVAAGRQKARDLSPLRRLLPFLRPYRAPIGVALVALVCSSTASLLIPPALGRLVQNGFNEAFASHIDEYFFPLIAIAVALAIATGVRFYFVTWLGERVVADIRKAVFDHVIGLTPAFFEVTRTGEVLSRMTADTTLIQTVVGSSASVAMRNVVMLSGALVLLFVTSTKLTGLVFGIVVLVLLPLILFGRWVRTLSRKSQDRLADTSARASETLNAIQTVQAFTREAAERLLFGKTVESTFDVAVARTRARAVMTTVVMAAVACCVVGVFWVGAHDVVAHRMTVGRLTQFAGYALIFVTGMGSISDTYGDLQRAAGASERLTELLTIEPEVCVPDHPMLLPARASGGVQFDHVTFRYPARPNQAALNGFSLKVLPGETVALVGPSGAGKSTVFQLLLRFFDPQSGTILFDGIDISRLDPSDLRRNVAIVAQDPVIFSGTIADNIRYGRQEASDAEVHAAAEASAALEFIERLPQSFDTIVGERGATLSGGQRQRIAIARAILRNAPLLLLDEATSALDSENERLVQHGLDNLMAGRTTIVIAHRLATIQRLKRIVVMDQGRIVGEGSHAELVAKGGLYARLADLQFSSARALAG
ncbi:MAG TPA: ABC transporter transmembrane domain-containing protein [Rhizomicrobium sp.]|jgi:ATP-binding cassette subfamily B protein|nr:ABC transporter transmembrane domain-containing protein [Rhizomicrobium sp.]